MTLNGHFVLTFVLGSDSNELACSGFQTKLFGNLQSYTHILVAAESSPKTPVSADISYGVIHWG